MRYAEGAVCVAAVAMLCLSPAAALGQVESHTLGPEMPARLMPAWVMAPPPFFTRAVAPVRPKNAPAPAAADRNPLTMPDTAREAIRLAEGGKWDEAVRMGQVVLKKEAGRLNAYTRDYVTNATAWALLHLNERDRARGLHAAAISQMGDPAVANYHRLVSVTLRSSKKGTEALCDPATFTAELRTHLTRPYEEFTEAIKGAKRSESVEGRLLLLRRAYGQLRLIHATDAELGRKLVQEQFRPAADSLVDTLAAETLDRARALTASLERAYKKVMKASSFPDWNHMVRTMWAEVATVKQICRIHHHLASAGLATPGLGRKPFEEAHRLLFCRNARRLVWQPVGFTHLVNGISQLDIRRRIAWQETLVTPLGADASQHTRQSNQGWQKMGKMDPMTGDGWEEGKPMDGSSWKKPNKMDSSGWRKPNKMDSGGWNRR